MKYIKYLLVIITGALLGVGSIIILQDDSKNDEVSENSIFEDNLIIPFSEEYIIGNDGDKSLYIRFKEEAFNIKEDEEFNYRGQRLQLQIEILRLKLLTPLYRTYRRTIFGTISSSR